MSSIRRLLARLFCLLQSNRAEADLAREIAAHLRLLEDQFIAQGMSAADARYAARRAFGGVEQVKERQRDARSFRWLHGASLDFKLGARLLAKYPGLTIVGGLAIAVAIAIGAAFFEFATQAVNPRLPLDEGDRIVGIRTWDTASAREERRTSRDVVVWRTQLKSVQELGAFRTVERNLIIADGAAEPIEVAAITASAFRLARVPPLLGRALADADEQPGAPPVIVIGHDVWQRRFAGDPAVVGRTVRLGRVETAVVGIMPEGFAFPVAHSLWAPLPLAAESEGGVGPSIQIFGRLARGVTIGQAQSELNAIASRAAADFPDTHRHMRPEVVPYAQSIFDFEIGGSALYAINLFFVAFLVLVCANVAALMLARAAARESEILVRTALGASRGRIVMQLFVEALVLGGLAAVAGIGAAGLELKWLLAVLEADSGRRLPFWFQPGVSPATMVYAGGLTVFGAMISGVGPALKVTRAIGTRLREASVAGRGLGFGGVWTVVIVAQVAVTVAFPAATFFVRGNVVQVQSIDVGFPAHEYLSVRLEADHEAPAGGGDEPSSAELAMRFRAVCEELQRRMTTEPGVIGVTFADRLPRTLHPRRRVEVEGNVSASAESAGPQRLPSASVALDFFDVLGSPIVAGRAFHSGDLASGAPVVIVNRSFAERVLNGANPIGRRMRYLTGDSDGPGQTGPWHEIVGVVGDLGMIGDDPMEGAGLYHPLRPGAASPVYMALHVNGDPELLAPRLRAIATAVDPTVRLRELLPLDAVGSSLWLEFNFLWRILGIVSGMALLLSLAGIYSVMAFTVSRRTREIGIRIALGADGRRVVAAIFSRALAQVGLGIAAGGVLVFLLTQAVTGLSARELAIVTAYMMVMMGVCMLACIVPTRRALAVEPTEALRAQ
jgi:putative ABC transport system permease protein